MSEMRIQDERDVAFRALCLGVLLKRSEFEITVQNLNEYGFTPAVRQQIINKHHILNSHLLKWVKKEKLNEHLSQREQDLLKRPLGTWSERLVIHTGWRVESLGVILWALGILDEIPPFDTQFDPDIVMRPLDLLTPTIDFIWCATLRPPAELATWRDIAELWNWRSRVSELERMGVKPQQGVTFRDIIRATAEKAQRLGGFDYLQSDDFPAFGRAYAQLDAEEYDLISSIANERYFALNWLCELSSTWEQVPVDI